MPAIRRLISSASVETASRKRLCHRNRRSHVVAKGEVCLVIKDADGGSKNYCIQCATAILDRAAQDLHDLRKSLFA